MATHPAFEAQKGKGRPKGSVNKDVKDIRDMIKQSLELAGGAEYLLRQAEENPTAYMSLIGKIIPKEVQASIDSKWEIVLSSVDVDI